MQDNHAVVIPRIVTVPGYDIALESAVLSKKRRAWRGIRRAVDNRMENPPGYWILSFRECKKYDACEIASKMRVQAMLVNRVEILAVQYGVELSNIGVS